MLMGKEMRMAGEREIAIRNAIEWMEGNKKLTAGEYNMIYVAMGFDLEPSSGFWRRLKWKIFGRKP